MPVDHLQHEGEEGRAAEDVPPSGPRRHRVRERSAGGRQQTATIVQPGEKLLDHGRPHDDRNRTGQNLDLTIPYAHGILWQGLGRRPGGDGTVGVIDAAMARAEKELGIAEPAHGAPEVCAVDGERGESRRILSAKPCRRAGSTPAQGSGEASSKVTLTVSPVLKPSTGPTERHTRGAFRMRGETRKPRTGTPMTAATALERATEIRVRKRRRSMVGSMRTSPCGYGRRLRAASTRSPDVESEHGHGGAEGVRLIRLWATVE